LADLARGSGRVCRQTLPDYSLEATYYRTALLLGLIRGDAVHQWAEQVIEQDPEPPHAFFEVASVPSTDLSAVRDALWPLVTEPDPSVVLEAVLGSLHEELASGRRGFTDTLTILRQMRSMLRLPSDMYAGLNAALVASVTEGAGGLPIVRWLEQFARSRLPTRS
jgi:hypothetical protein